MEAMREKLISWLIYGERGISSEAMCAVFLGKHPNMRWASFGNHPRDPNDFKRCSDLLKAVPEARNHMHRVARLSDAWKNLVDNWDELEELLEEELPKGKAPKLYKRMQELGC